MTKVTLQELKIKLGPIFHKYVEGSLSKTSLQLALYPQAANREFHLPIHLRFPDENDSQVTESLSLLEQELENAIKELFPGSTSEWRKPRSIVGSSIDSDFPHIKSYWIIDQLIVSYYPYYRVFECPSSFTRLFEYNWS